MGNLKDERQAAHELLSQKRRVFDRKEDARKHAWNAIEAQRVRRHKLMRERDEARAEGHEDRVIDLTKRIQDATREISNLEDQLKQIASRMHALRDTFQRIEGRIKDLTRRIKRRKRQEDKPDAYCLNSGSPCWGGGADIFKYEVIPAAGTSPHSTKRVETYGNPGSDHHVSQINAYAGDFPSSTALALRIAYKLGVGWRGYGDDYKAYYIVRAGRTFRVQIIASNHGTGPHVHVGIERVN